MILQNAEIVSKPKLNISLKLKSKLEEIDTEKQTDLIIEETQAGEKDNPGINIVLTKKVTEEGTRENLGKETGERIFMENPDEFNPDPRVSLTFANPIKKPKKKEKR